MNQSTQPLSLDALSRRSSLVAQSTGKRVTPTTRDLWWFEKLFEHGALPTSFLLAFSSDTHRSEKRAKERLTDLFHEDNTPHGGTYLARPPQQLRTLDSRHNQKVYELAPAGVRALSATGYVMSHAGNTSGPWAHGCLVACFTASMELATRRTPSLTYIPQHNILTRAETSLAYPLTGIDPTTKRRITRSLVPDAVFGLAYHTATGTRYRCFAVEVDRATEPVRSACNRRKSLARGVAQYRDYVEGQGYRQHLKIKAPLLVLNVFGTDNRVQQLRDLITAQSPKGNAYMLTSVWPACDGVFRPPRPIPDILSRAWHRAGAAPFCIGTVSGNAEP